MVQHLESLNRSVQVVNLDPAAEHFDYPVMAGEYSMVLSYYPELWLHGRVMQLTLIIVLN